MTFVVHKSTIRAIRQGDKDFTLVDGLTTYPRAMLHVLPECPHNIAEMISYASKNGWLKCVAHVHDNELMWDKLNHD
jgi:hypothetical protein